MLPALDRLANNEGGTGSAVVSSGSVVVDPSSKLREKQHDYIVGGIVLPQIGEEVGYGLRNIGPKRGVHPHLVGVGIEAAVVTVKEPFDASPSARAPDAGTAYPADRRS